MSETRFIVDHMLGSLARWLRFMGFDTLYPSLIDDEKIVEIATQENRIILTRDLTLSNRKRKSATSIYIKSDKLSAQISQVLRTIPKFTLHNMLSRCSLCNTILIAVDKKYLSGKVPEMVYEYHDEFWFCNSCNKYYWKGTHYKQIRERIDKMLKEVEKLRV